MTFKRQNLGKKGEKLAVKYLKKQGYGIIKKNYKTKLGEIDIIGNDRGCICFVEVRTRNSGSFGRAEDSIDRNKQLKIAQNALMYIKYHGLKNKTCRFDVVAVTELYNEAPQIKLIKNAFDLEGMYSY